jgi:UDP-N-acetylmuramyl tripeptide synthase
VTSLHEPNHGFDDSRRLTGPNRHFATPAVTLSPLGAAAANTDAHRRWRARVQAMCAELGWPDPQPQVLIHPGGTLLVFAAPHDTLFTATEVNEWAWELAAAEADAVGASATTAAVPAGPTSFDRAQDLGETAAAVFAARAAEERSQSPAALRAAAVAHGVPLFEDDREVSLGAGTGSRRWLRGDLPPLQSISWSELHDIPTALVTGSNGKTTTVRLLAAMAEAAGLTAGYSSTEGIVVGGQMTAGGDYSGPDGARAVLRDPRVQMAILETARGGILRRGLAVQRADVAVVTNISADHLGEYGIAAADGLAETKLVVAHALAAGGTLVLNADDAVLAAAAARLPHVAAVHQALFALDHDHPALIAMRTAGGSTCGVRGRELVLFHRGTTQVFGDAHALPLTLGGAARYNIANLAAAALAGTALGLPAAAIADTLTRFGSTPADNPGRLECWWYRGARVLIDYAHNPEGLAGLLRVARDLQPQRLLLLLGQAGNRDDGAIIELARTAAQFAPEQVVVKELPLMLRGRAPGEVSGLIARALAASGLPPARIIVEPDEERAARLLLNAARPHDVVVLPVHTEAVRRALRNALAAT